MSDQNRIEALEAVIRDINDELETPLSEVDRALYVGDRADAQEELNRLKGESHA